MKVDLHQDGLLWFVNRSLLHPRGFALGVAYDEHGVAHWELVGDGREPWTFGIDENVAFAAVEAAFARAREENAQ